MLLVRLMVEKKPRTVTIAKLPRSLLTNDVLRFLEMNKSLEPSLSTVISEVLSFLDNEGILYKLYVDVARDIEATKWEALKVHVNIENREFSEILKIWDNVCREVYRKLDKQTAKKFYVTMRKA